MPEVVRGSRPSLQVDSPQQSERRVGFAPDVVDSQSHENGPASPTIGISRSSTEPMRGVGRKSTDKSRRLSRSHSRHDDDPNAPAYYDSRAATKREFKRRASTLQDYYKEHPEFLPQLPFTMRRGWKRWKLGFTIILMFADACLLPIALYYGLAFGANVQGWIIFAIVTTLWGGPTYIEFAFRSLRLMKKENFYRPLGQTSRWKFDITHFVFIFTITVVTALFIVGSAPHNVWLRVLSMPGPAILYTLCGPLLLQTGYNLAGWKAPFRLSSTAKGEKVHPGAYYFLEDILAVTGGAGRPFREALASRYEASPKFRKMLLQQSLFWSIPGLIVAIALTVVVIISSVSEPVAYGVGEFLPQLRNIHSANDEQDGEYRLFGQESGLASVYRGFRSRCVMNETRGKRILATSRKDTQYADLCRTKVMPLSRDLKIDCNSHMPFG